MLSNEVVKSNLETFGYLFLKIVKSNVKIVDFLSNEVVIYAIYKFHINSFLWAILQTI